MPKHNHSSHSVSTSGLFTTDSLYLAGFLHAHGLRLSTAETDGWGAYRFAFWDGGELRTRVHEFHSAPKALVDARTFMYALEDLKDRVGRARCWKNDPEIDYDV